MNSDFWWKPLKGNESQTANIKAILIKNKSSRINLPKLKMVRKFKVVHLCSVLHMDHRFWILHLRWPSNPFPFLVETMGNRSDTHRPPEHPNIAMAPCSQLIVLISSHTLLPLSYCLFQKISTVKLAVAPDHLSRRLMLYWSLSLPFWGLRFVASRWSEIASDSLHPCLIILLL